MTPNEELLIEAFMNIVFLVRWMIMLKLILKENAWVIENPDVKNVF